MVLFFQAIVSGLTIGAIYALVAVGYNVVYASTQVFNLAQGQLVMVGVMMMYEFREVMGWPTVMAAAGAVLVAGLINVAVERVCVARQPEGPAQRGRRRPGHAHHTALARRDIDVDRLAHRGPAGVDPEQLERVAGTRLVGDADP